MNPVWSIKYKPEYCEQVVAYGKAGKSLTWIATELGVVKQTVYNWMKDYPEFGAAMQMARQYSQQWWEDMGQTNLEKPVFQASMWSRSIGARFPEDWREIKGQEISGRDGGPVETIQRIERVIIDPK